MGGATGTGRWAGEGREPLGRIVLVFLRLGLTSFGGPVAHLGYFRDEFVARRRWIEERAYADLVALCQFLPGPASSQVGMAIGLAKGGLPGAVAAWLAFTMPSAVALMAFGLGVTGVHGALDAGVLHGLKVVAVAVVAQAVWGMARTLCPDAPRGTVAVLAAIATLAWPTVLGQVGVIVAAAVVGLVALRVGGELRHASLAVEVSRAWGLAALVAFFALLLALPLATALVPRQGVALLDSFYRSGALVFGGGHVVLPLLQAEVVPRGWVTKDAFLAGYGAAQAVPGPLFTFAAYLGMVMAPGLTGVGFALLCLVAVFTPSFLLIIGALPFWDELRRLGPVQSALRGVNAAVVGLLLSALYRPVWTSAILSTADFALGLGAFMLLAFWRVPPWLVVILTAAGRGALEVLGVGAR